MSFWSGRVTLSTTGNQTYTLGVFTPTWARFRISPDSATAKLQYGEGSTDGTNQNFNALYTDSTGSQIKGGNTKCVSLYDRVSGTMTEVLAATFVSFGNNGVNGTITLNVTAASTNYKVTIECGD